jgi:IS5 family transposase
VDTTVVETNVHYPTDSALLADGVRVLTRTMQRLGPRLRGAAGQVRNRARRVARRVFAIGQRTRTATARVSAAVRERSKAGLKQLYQELMGITRGVVRGAEPDPAPSRAPDDALGGAARNHGLSRRCRGRTT